MKRLVFTAVALGLAGTMTASAQTSDRDVLEALGKCAAVTDSAQRLACYDAAAPQLKSTLITPPPVLARAPTQEEQSSWFGFSFPDIFGGSPSSQTTPQQFGSNTLPRQQRAVIASAGNANTVATAPIDSITATVTEYALNDQGRYVIFLDNGQVWRQQNGDSGVMQFKRNSPNTVKISRGFWDSYNLKINNGSALYKVVRVK